MINEQKTPMRVTGSSKPVEIVQSSSEYQLIKRQTLQVALIEGEVSSDVENFSIAAIKNQLNNSNATGGNK